jgi:3D (Asp-Asp-Asp) domain-containing protein
LTRRQLRLWFAALTLILLSLWAVLFWVNTSPSPPPKHAVTRHTEALKAKEPSRGERVLVMEATAYCYGTITKTGTTPAEGRTVAVDPDVIHLGSHLTINGVPGYVAEDTGSAVKGYAVDLYLTDYARCIQFGRQMVRVEVKE